MRVTRLLVVSAVLVLVQAAAGQVKMPITERWNVEELKKVGKIVDTRNEAAGKNQVVWVLEVKEVPQKLGLAVNFLDSEKGRLHTEKPELSVVKGTEKGAVKQIAVTLKLPPEIIQKGTAFVRFVKASD
jgi:hypothetical protein